MRHTFLALSLVSILSQSTFARTELVGADQLRSQLGLTSYPAVQNDLKIAIFDNGFMGYEPGSGDLPETTVVVPGPVNPELPTNHGFVMARIIWNLTGSHPQGPQFYLMNTSGYSNFKAAIDRAISEKVDVILYSQTWDFGGAFDGKGFINAQVSRATSAGILWVNAAGNNANQVYNGYIESISQSGVARVSGALDAVGFRVLLDESPVNVTLAWNDVGESENQKATTDLDLVIMNDSKKELGRSEKIQDGRVDAGVDDQSSAFARERMSLQLGRGEYAIQIRSKASSVKPGTRVRISVTSDKPHSIDFFHHSDGGEVMIPADHPEVFTIGDLSDYSARGPTMDGRSKPDVLMPVKELMFSDGSQSAGTSNAAPVFVATYLTLKSVRSDLSRDRLQSYVERLPRYQDRKLPHFSHPLWRTPQPWELEQL